jgi:hypothetical protein
LQSIAPTRIFPVRRRDRLLCAGGVEALEVDRGFLDELLG